MVTYARERLSNCRNEIEALVPEQWDEMAKGFERFEEKVDWDGYLAAEQRGNLYLIVARDEGKMVGYFGATSHKSKSFDAWVIQSTPYYVVPCRARGLILRRMLKNLIAGVKADSPIVTVKTHPHASAARLFEAMGFRPVETWFMLDTKRLSHA